MSRPPSVTLRLLAEPSQVNFGGKVHGGAVMKWLDQAGYACAAGWAGQYCVTAWVGAIRFLRPIGVGELVEVRARLIHTGRTSMQIAVDVYAGAPTSAEQHRAGHCVMTFVAVDPEGRPAPVPPWRPETPVDLALDDYARRLMEMRASLDREIEERLRWLDQQRPAVTGRG